MTKTIRRLFPSPFKPIAFPALLLVLAFMWPPSIVAADYYPPRVSHVDGGAAYIPAGKVDWEEVSVNIPMLNGDRIFAQADSRLEIELGDANFLRLADETDLTFSATLEKEIGLRLDEGVLILRINKTREIRIQTPFAIVSIKKKGLYRVGVDDSGQMQVIVRKGRAYIETANGKQKLTDGEEVVLGARYQGPMQVSQYSYQDEFDRWSDRRDAGYLSSQSVSYVGGSYYPGVYDLDRYGYWTSYPGYGTVWIPHVSFGWSPYRYGSWFSFGFGFGWTWISHEPWGWLPYHYGNWHYYQPHRRWCWIPGGFRSWSPHRVNFYHGGGYVGWAPRPHQFVNSNNVTIINNNTVINRPPRNGLTVVRREDFGARGGSADRSLTASRAVVDSFQAGLPVDLPVTRRAAVRQAPAGRDQVAGRTAGPAPSNSRSVGRAATSSASQRQAAKGTDTARTLGSGNSFTQRGDSAGTARVLRAGGGRTSSSSQSPATVTSRPRDDRSTTTTSNSKIRARTVTSRSTRESSPSNNPNRGVPRISRPAAGRAISEPAPPRSESGVRKGSTSLAPESSIRTYSSRPANSSAIRQSTAPNSSLGARPNSSSSRSFSRPNSTQSRNAFSGPTPRIDSKSRTSGSYNRQSLPAPSVRGSRSRSSAPSSIRSFSIGRAPTRSSPSPSYSRPSSPSRGGASSRSSAPSRSRPSGRSQRN